MNHEVECKWCGLDLRTTRFSSVQAHEDVCKKHPKRRPPEQLELDLKMPDDVEAFLAGFDAASRYRRPDVAINLALRTWLKEPGVEAHKAKE